MWLRKIDPDAVADDAPVAARQLEQLAAHTLGMPSVGKVADRLLCLPQGERNLLQDPFGHGGGHEPIATLFGDRREPCPVEAEQRFLGRRGSRILPAVPSNVITDRDPRVNGARKTTNP